MPHGVKDPGTVLCAVDDSPHAAAVLYAGAGLAQHLGARLVVLRVNSRVGDSDEALDAQVELNELVLRTLPGSVGYRGSTDPIVRAGDPASTILSVAREWDASLIVMGSRARGRVTRALLGSTVQRVVRDTRVPVAVVPPTDPEIVTVSDKQAVPHYGALLIGLDLHSPPEGPLMLAGLLAAKTQTRTVLLHVAPNDADPGPLLSRLTALQAAIGNGFPARAVVEKGDVVEGIVHRVKREGAGVVVLGRDRKAAGAVTCEILRQTNAVVVVVP